MKELFKSGRSPHLKVFLCMLVLLSSQNLAQASEGDFLSTLHKKVQKVPKSHELDISLLDSDIDISVENAFSC